MAEDSKVFAAICVALSWIGFLIAYFAKKDDDYVMYYGKQGLAFTIFIVLLGIVSMIGTVVLTVLTFIPGVGLITGLIFILLIPVYLLASLALMVLWVIGIINALSGKKKPIPFMGMISDKLPF
jgi:uncharacterized Tic20 family protein